MPRISRTLKIFSKKELSNNSCQLTKIMARCSESVLTTTRIKRRRRLRPRFQPISKILYHKIKTLLTKCIALCHVIISSSHDKSREKNLLFRKGLDDFLRPRVAGRQGTDSIIIVIVQLKPDKVFFVCRLGVGRGRPVLVGILGHLSSNFDGAVTQSRQWRIHPSNLNILISD